jgi:glycosyltransferase involved in cell wall biosynthesis
MKLLYVSKAFEGNIGATMHYRALQEIVGEENVFTVDLRTNSPKRKDRYIAYGKYRNIPERIKRWSQGNTMFISNQIIDELIDIIKKENIDIAFIEDSVFGSLIKKIRRRCPLVQTISFYHDINAMLYPQWQKMLHPRWQKKARLVGKIEYAIGMRQEKINSSFCEINIVFNQRDADIYQKTYGKAPEAIIALPAPVPLMDMSYMKKTSDRRGKKTLMFVGKRYYANDIGIQWFCEQVLPSLSSNIKIQIVGRGLEYLRDELSDSRIEVIGEVESLEPYYKNADIIIAPLFHGGGMKSKTVEATSYGKVFVGTEESLFGFWEEMDENIRNQTVFQCSTAEQWIETLNSLTEKVLLKYNQKLFELFVGKFSYQASKIKLESIIKNNR